MDWIKINGKNYDVIVTAVEESFSILYSENTGRTLASGAPMVLDPLGTFYNYSVTFRRKEGHEKDYDDLFDYVSQPRYSGILVSLVHGQTVWDDYEAYISEGKRALKRIDEKTGKVYWDELQLKITPIKAQVIPT